MSALVPRRWVPELRAQWVASRGLRLGVWTIAGLLWVQGLLMLGDVVGAWQEREHALREDLARVQALARERSWTQRADDARQQVNAFRSMLWPAADRGLAEASVQDWVRATAAKANVRLREVALVRGVPQVSAAGSAASTLQVPSVRLRVVTDLDALPVMALLAEFARHERAVVVDRLVLRTASQPPQAEMELRMPLSVEATRQGLAR